MRVRALPKRWLIHTIQYIEKAEDDGWGNHVNPDPITIKHVRVDNKTVFSRDSTDEKILANAVIFVDFKHSTNLPVKFKEDSTINWIGDNGNIIETYVLKKIGTL